MKKQKNPGGWKTIPVRKAPPEEGLTQPEVAERRAGGWANDPVESPTKSVRTIVQENLFTYFNLIFVLLATCLVLVGSFKNMLFLGIAAANTIIGIIQQIRSKRTVDKLTLLAAPHARAVREGALTTIPTAELVRDDVVELHAGDQISADGLVLSGTVLVNEALLTGEADAVEKGPEAELLSGSFVVAGHCRARLTRVGADSYAARLTLEAKKDVKVGRSEMMAALDQLIRVIGLLLIPIGGVLFSKQFFWMHLSLHDAVVSTVAALIGMIPEGLYLLTSVALAVSVIRLAQHKTLVQEMSCIETLARVDVLCVDKTGTITEPGMQAGELIPLAERTCPAKQLEEILSAFYRVSDADNDTARAMAQRFPGGPDWGTDKIVPFTSAAKWSAVAFSGHGTFLVGAPEFILGHRYREIQGQVEPWSAKGYRVLLLAEYGGLPTLEALNPAALTPLALVLLSNPIRATAPATFRYFKEQGVSVKVISGDSPLTVAEVARQAGIEGAGHWVDASTLESEASLADAAKRYTVFGRVTPEQKRKLIKALQRGGHTVAMTGDGVNDVLALKDADCGVAMASGSDAACHAAQLVLLDSDFSSMPLVVDEGRRVINNIQRAASLFLVKNIFSFFLSFLTLFTVFTYPFAPIQLSLVGGLTIGVPSFFLALEPNHSLVRGKFMRNVLRAAFPGGLTNLILIFAIQIFCLMNAVSPEVRSTLCTLSMGFTGLLVLFQVCKPLDKQRWLVWGTMAAGLVGAVVLLSDLFSLVPLSPNQLLALASFCLAAYPVLWLLQRLFDRGAHLVTHRQQTQTDHNG